MEIKIQIYGRVFSLCFGYKTKWFEQIYFLTLEELYHDKRQVVYAKMLWSFWKDSNFKKEVTP